MYISYNCVKRNGSIKCKNHGIRRDDLGKLVLERLSSAVFSENVLPIILAQYNEYALSRNAEYITIMQELKHKLSDTEKGISNIVNVVV